MFNKHWVSPWIIVRRKHADPSAVPADEGFSNCAMPMTSEVPWNISVIIKSSRDGFSGPKSRSRPRRVRQRILQRLEKLSLAVLVPDEPLVLPLADELEEAVPEGGGPPWLP
jgi:hypothetical protein